MDRALDDELLAMLRDRYIAHLREEILMPGAMPTAEYLGPRGGIKSVMPGIRELLDALQQRPDVFLGLLTGNFEEGARIKLEHFDLWRYFRCGGVTETTRRIGMRSCRSRSSAPGEPGCRRSPPGTSIVVGDTPHDIACARAAGAIPVGVATGGLHRRQLRACGADIVFKDLGDREAFLELLD